MQGDYQKTEKLLVRKSLFAFAAEPSFAKRFVPEFVACEPGMKILDVGCGTGEDLATIQATVPNCKLFGLDFSQGMIDEAKKKVPEATFFVANMETFSLPEKFNRIIVRHALHLANNQKQAVKNVFNHLTQNGKAIFALHSTKSLPKMSKLVTNFCKKYKISFIQGKTTLAVEHAQELFKSYKTKTIVTQDTLILSEPTPYISYLESRRKNFLPAISDEAFKEMCTSLKEIIEKEISLQGVFTEVSTNGIIIVEKT